MNRSLKWKLIFLISVILFCGAVVMPSFNKNLPDWWQKYLAPEGLRLGLDLQGGMHLVMRVDLDKAAANTLNFAAQDLKEALLDKQISVVRTDSGDPHKVVFTLPNTGALSTVEETVKGDFSDDLDIEVMSEEGSFPRIILTLNKEKISFINKNAVNQSLEIIRNRIDQFGVAEPVIVKQGHNEIIIQLPGVKDPERALALIGQTAQLEFKLVDETGGVDIFNLIGQAEASGQWSWNPKQSWNENTRKLNQILQSQLPAGTAVYFEKDIERQTLIERRIPMLIKTQTLMTGEMVKDAQVRVGGTFNEPYVSLDLTGRGGKVFGQITEKNVKKRLAIVLDNVVRSAPRIQEKILGGSAQITGSFTFEDATDLAIVLRVGALPAPVEIVQNLTVGASLGHDSIKKGLMSGLLGTLLVMLFMVFYYRLSGVIANAALVFNILLLFAGLATMNATLTLPGIAGIILAIGMAVDSNVLIFERMREEFALGKSVKSGVEGGYDNALSTIIDSQVTTLITSLALFLFGTGPIKGFAVTLSLGVIFNLFTTLFATRIVYDTLHSMKKLKPLNFYQFIKRPNLDYMSIRKITFCISGVLVLVGLLAFVQILRGQANLGVDFAGGTLLQYKAAQPFSLKEVRTAFTQNNLDADLQLVENENQLIVKIKKSEDVVGQLTDQTNTILNENLADKKFELESQSEIGSSVSDTLRNKALQAIAISLFGVICYLALRFDLRFGFAAAVATFHDVLVVLGICWILDIEITLLMVTALLTLAGYSLNDTVVVFDRIRENLKKSGGLDLVRIINGSVNDVLGRTIIASLTTSLALIALYFFGGKVIHDFSFALLIGILVGTYSSIFIASPLLYLWRKDKEA
ncbi:MAG: protein translocase subunit SecD [Proteobacteria bacterium]|nr:protein translocase subunit SecD [Pseudomonadota bacterium]